MFQMQTIEWEFHNIRRRSFNCFKQFNVDEKLIECYLLENRSASQPAAAEKACRKGIRAESLKQLSPYSFLIYFIETRENNPNAACVCFVRLKKAQSPKNIKAIMYRQSKIQDILTNESFLSHTQHSTFPYIIILNNENHWKYMEENGKHFQNKDFFIPTLISFTFSTKS